MANKVKETLDIALEQINKQFGQGSVMRLGETDFDKAAGKISTGSLSIDHALGIGGVAKGRIIEIYGPEGSGKTTLCLSILASAQREGAICAFVDSEHGLDPEYATKLGVDPDELIISQPDNAEQALTIVEALVRTGEIGVIVLDSVAAMVPVAELEGEVGDQKLGLMARLMSQAMRRLTAIVHNTDTCLIFTNQIRMKIGVMYGSPETTPGGQALKFHASQRMDIRRTGQITSGKSGEEEIVGVMGKVKVLKNKLAPPFRVAEFALYFGEGISLEYDLLTMGVVAGIVTKKGAWFSYKDQQLGQGLENSRAFLKANTAIRDEIEKALRNHLGL